MITMLSLKTMLLPVTLGAGIGGHGNTTGMSLHVGNQTAEAGSYLEDYSGDNLLDYDGNKLEDY